MNQDLLEIFKNVNEWLKFAEAKNAMLIALNGVAIFGVGQIQTYDFISKHYLVEIWLSLAIVVLVFSTVCSLLSFVPRLKIVKEGLFTSKTECNRFYFESLRSLSGDEIIDKVLGTGKSTNASELDKDLAEQIRQNAKITSRKYSYFTIAIWMTISAMISIPLAFIFMLLVYRNR